MSLTKYYVHRPAVAVKFNYKIALANKIKRITYLNSRMAERRQESRSSDGAVKITQKRYRLGIEKISLKGLKGIAF